MCEYDVLLSHASADKPTVEKIARKLRDEHEMRVFFDQWNPAQDTHQQDALQEGLASSRTCVVFVGSEDMGPWHKDETRIEFGQRAVDEAERFVLVLLPGAEKDNAPEFFAQGSWIDLRYGVDNEAALELLIDGIRGTARNHEPSAQAILGDQQLLTPQCAKKKSPRSALARWRRARPLDRGILLGILGVLLTTLAWVFPRTPDPSLLPDLYTVRVQILDPSGRPAEGATVRASSGNKIDLLPNGWWQIEVPYAELPFHKKLTLWAEHPQWNSAHTILQLAEDPNLQAEIRLAASGQAFQLLVKALDQHGRALKGIRFAFSGEESLPTTETGVTDLTIPDLNAGEALKLDLPRSVSEEWLLVDSIVHTPAGPREGPAEVVLIKRSEIRELASSVRDATGQATRPGKEVSEDQRQRILIEYAAQHGLSQDELTRATSAFGQTEDPQDRGIAAYLAGEYQIAETELEKAAKNQESDFVEALRYLGASQYAQGKYAAAATTFRKTVAVRSDDSVLLNWLGLALCRLAIWDEAESLMRRALAIDESSFGPDHPKVAKHLNDLALLLETTNRLPEAEPLMRRALVINETSFGPDHPDVAKSLNNLALFLKAMNRLSEAEPLMRRALAIDEASFGPDHPKVASRLHNQALLLKAAGRLSEAESLMRRALAIDEASFGPNHPKVAKHLNDLALLLEATDRLSEAVPLMRRALAIDEASFGPNHPHVATSLNNLGLFLKAMDRLSEAEPLMRRALAIDEASFGPDHPHVAIRLHNLASLFEVTNRLGEAEPLMDRALEIFESSLGEAHPTTRLVREDLTALKSKLEIASLD